MSSLADAYSQLSVDEEQKPASNTGSLADAYDSLNASNYDSTYVPQPEEDLQDKLAFAARMGFSDTYRGIKQIFGVDEADMSADQKRLESYFKDPDHGGKVLAAYTAGLVGDPVGWVIPGMKAKNAASAAKAGVLFGSITGATGYVPEDMTRAEASLLSAATGGILSPSLYKFNTVVAPKMSEAYGKNIVPLLEKAGNKITTKAGKYPTLRNLGRQFIEDLDLPPAYVDARRNIRIDKNKYADEWLDAMEGLDKLNRQESELAYRLMNGEASKNAPDLSKLTKKSRETVDKFGQKMVKLGILDKDVYRANKGKYLSRTYKSTAIPEDKKMHREAGGLKIIGTEFMRRGETKPIAVDELDTYLEEGWKQVSKIDPKTGTVKVNKDYDIETRKKMGEITDVAYAMAKTGQLMTNDLATYKFYDVLAKDRTVSWSVDDVIDNLTKREIAALPAEKLRAPEGYIKVSEDTIGGTEIKKWGNLAGRYVPKAVYDDLIAADKFKVWKDSGLGRLNHQMLSWWKRTKTTLNPTVHMNNTIANTKHYDVADGDWKLFREGIQDMRKGNDVHKLAKQYGVYNADLRTNELNSSSRNYLQKYLNHTVSDTDNPKFMDKLWNQTKFKLTEFARETPLDRIYSLEDNVFRLGLFKTKMKEFTNNGKLAPTDEMYKEAAKYSRKWMIDYEVHAPGIKKLRELPLPFITYTYRAAPLMWETAYKKPWKFAKWATILYGANQIGIDVSDDDVERERRLLNETTKVNTLFGMEIFPSTQIKVPRTDKSQYLDVNRWYPLGDVFATGSQTFDLPLLPQPLQPSFGSLGGVGKVLTGFDTFTGKLEPGVGSGIFSEEVKGRANLFFKEFLPPIVPGGYSWERITDANSGYHPTKDDYNLGEAVLNSIGIKVKNFEERKMTTRVSYTYRARMNSLKADLNRAAKDFYGKRISREDFEKTADRIERQLREIQRDYQEAIKY